MYPLDSNPDYVRFGEQPNGFFAGWINRETGDLFVINRDQAQRVADYAIAAGMAPEYNPVLYKFTDNEYVNRGAANPADLTGSIDLSRYQPSLSPDGKVETFRFDEAVGLLRKIYLPTGNTEGDIFSNIRTKSLLSRVVDKVKPQLVVGRVEPTTYVDRPSDTERSNLRKFINHQRDEYRKLISGEGRLFAGALRTIKNRSLGGEFPTNRINNPGPGNKFLKQLLAQMTGGRSTADYTNAFHEWMTSAQIGSKVTLASDGKASGGVIAGIPAQIAGAGFRLGVDASFTTNNSLILEKVGQGTFRVTVKATKEKKAGVRGDLTATIPVVGGAFAWTGVALVPYINGTEDTMVSKDLDLHQTTSLIQKYFDRDLEVNDFHKVTRQVGNKLSTWVSAGPGVAAPLETAPNVGFFPTATLTKDLPAKYYEWEVSSSTKGAPQNQIKTSDLILKKSTRVGSKPISVNVGLNFDAGYGASGGTLGVTDTVGAGVNGGLTTVTDTVAISTLDGQRHEWRRVDGETALAGHRVYRVTKYEALEDKGASRFTLDKMFGEERANQILQKAQAILRKASEDRYELRKRNLSFDVKFTIKDHVIENLRREIRPQLLPGETVGMGLSRRLDEILDHPSRNVSKLDFSVKVTEKLSFSEGVKFKIPVLTDNRDSATLTAERSFDLGDPTKPLFHLPDDTDGDYFGFDRPLTDGSSVGATAADSYGKLAKLNPGIRDFLVAAAQLAHADGQLKADEINSDEHASRVSEVRAQIDDVLSKISWYDPADPMRGELLNELQLTLAGFSGDELNAKLAAEERARILDTIYKLGLYDPRISTKLVSGVSAFQALVDDVEEKSASLIKNLEANTSIADVISATPEAWAAKSAAEKQAYVAQVLNEAVTGFGLETAPLLDFSSVLLDGNAASSNFETNTITLSEDLLSDPFSIAEELTHEVTHFYQRDLIRKYLLNELPEGNEKVIASLLKAELDVNSSADLTAGKFINYADQLSERGAYYFGEKIRTTIAGLQLKRDLISIVDATAPDSQVVRDAVARTSALISDGKLNATDLKGTLSDIAEGMKTADDETFGDKLRTLASRLSGGLAVDAWAAVASSWPQEFSAVHGDYFKLTEVQKQSLLSQRLTALQANTGEQLQESQTKIVDDLNNGTYDPTDLLNAAEQAVEDNGASVRDLLRTELTETLSRVAIEDPEILERRLVSALYGPAFEYQFEQRDFGVLDQLDNLGSSPNDLTLSQRATDFFKNGLSNGSVTFDEIVRSTSSLSPHWNEEGRTAVRSALETAINKSGTLTDIPDWSTALQTSLYGGASTRGGDEDYGIQTDTLRQVASIEKLPDGSTKYFDADDRQIPFADAQAYFSRLSTASQNVKDMLASSATQEGILAPSDLAAAVRADILTINKKISDTLRNSKHKLSDVSSVDFNEQTNSLSVHLQPDSSGNTRTLEVVVPAADLKSATLTSEFAKHIKSYLDGAGPQGSPGSGENLARLNKGLGYFMALRGFQGAMQELENGDVGGGIKDLFLSLYGVGDLTGVNRKIYNKIAKTLSKKIFSESERAVSGAGVQEPLDEFISKGVSRIISKSGLVGEEAAARAGEFAKDIPIVGLAFGIYSIYQDVEKLKHDQKNGAAEWKIAIDGVDLGLDSAITALQAIEPFTGPLAPVVEAAVVALTVVRVFIDDVAKDIHDELAKAHTTGEKVEAVIKGYYEGLWDTVKETGEFVLKDLTIPGLVFQLIEKIEGAYSQKLVSDAQFGHLTDVDNIVQTKLANGRTYLRLAGGRDGALAGGMNVALGENGQTDVSWVRGLRYYKDDFGDDLFEDDYAKAKAQLDEGIRNIGEVNLGPFGIGGVDGQSSDYDDKDDLSFLTDYSQYNSGQLGVELLAPQAVIENSTVNSAKPIDDVVLSGGHAFVRTHRPNADGIKKYVYKRLVSSRFQIVNGNSRSNHFFAPRVTSAGGYYYETNGNGGADTLVLGGLAKHKFDGGQTSADPDSFADADTLNLAQLDVDADTALYIDLSRSADFSENIVKKLPENYFNASSRTLDLSGLSDYQAYPTTPPKPDYETGTDSEWEQKWRKHNPEVTLQVYVKDVENLIGSNNDEVLSGNSARNTITSGGGRDVFVRSAGDDLYIIGKSYTDPDEHAYGDTGELKNADVFFVDPESAVAFGKTTVLFSEHWYEDISVLFDWDTGLASLELKNPEFSVGAATEETSTEVLFQNIDQVTQSSFRSQDGVLFTLDASDARTKTVHGIVGESWLAARSNSGLHPNSGTEIGTEFETDLKIYLSGEHRYDIGTLAGYKREVILSDSLFTDLQWAGLQGDRLLLETKESSGKPKMSIGIDVGLSDLGDLNDLQFYTSDGVAFKVDFGFSISGDETIDYSYDFKDVTVNASEFAKHHPVDELNLNAIKSVLAENGAGQIVLSGLRENTVDLTAAGFLTDDKHIITADTASYVYGGTGRNILIAGKETEILDGGEGFDTYQIGLGSNVNVIDDTGSVVGGRVFFSGHAFKDIKTIGETYTVKGSTHEALLVGADSGFADREAIAKFDKESAGQYTFSTADGVTFKLLADQGSVGVYRYVVTGFDTSVWRKFVKTNGLSATQPLSELSGLARYTVLGTDQGEAILAADLVVVKPGKGDDTITVRNDHKGVRIQLAHGEGKKVIDFRAGSQTTPVSGIKPVDVIFSDASYAQLDVRQVTENGTQYVEVSDSGEAGKELRVLVKLSDLERFNFVERTGAEFTINPTLAKIVGSGDLDAAGSSEIDLSRESYTFTDASSLSVRSGRDGGVIKGVLDKNNKVTGLGGDDNVTGGNLQDTISVGSGDDLVDAGKGDDLILGGLGRDTLDGGAGLDTAIYSGSGNSGGVHVNLKAGHSSGAEADGDRLISIENLVGTNASDTLIGDTEDNVLRGRSGNDTLRGNGGTDVLEGGKGEDLLLVRRGDNVFLSKEGEIDIVSEFGETNFASYDGETDTIQLWFDQEDLVAVMHGDNLVLSAPETTIVLVDWNKGSGYQNYKIEFRDNAFDRDQFSAWVANNASVASSSDANGSGAATSRGDHLLGDEADNSLDGYAGRDTLIGSGGDDTLIGGYGADVLEGGDGFDDLRGGAGFDTASYKNSTSAISISVVSNFHFKGTELIANFENYAANSGDAFKDKFNSIERIVGTEHDDSIILFHGLEAAVGGAGNDALKANNMTSSVELHGDAGQDRLSGGSGGDILHGGTGADSLEGNAGDDHLVGGTGADTLVGGSGLDFVSYGHSTEGVYVNLSSNLGDGGDAEGDRITGVEGVIGSKFNDYLVGDKHGNTLKARRGNDFLDGGAGNDTLFVGGGDQHVVYGGEGVDAVSYEEVSDRIHVDLSQNLGLRSHTDFSALVEPGRYGRDSLFDIESVRGSYRSDIIHGDYRSNKIEALDGDDSIGGGAGSDTLDGGDGNDWALYSRSSSGVTVDLRSATQVGGNWGDAAGDQLISIENVLGSRRADSLTGDGSDNILEGGDGADTLDGQSGRDTLSYATSSTAVTVDLSINSVSGGDAEGDRISNFQDVQGSRFGDILKGSDEVNDLDGGDGDDRLIASGDTDVLRGGAGSDTADYSQVARPIKVDLGDLVDGMNIVTQSGVGTDRLQGIENIIGTHGSDTITGDSGDNVIEGKGGPDSLSGGEGNDTLSYAGSVGYFVHDQNYWDGVHVDLAANTASHGDAGDENSGQDTISGFESMLGSVFSDELLGSEGGNFIQGNGWGGRNGQQTNGNSDSIDGRGGEDTVSFDSGFFNTQGVNVDLDRGKFSSNSAHGEGSISNVEIILGSRSNDTFRGNDQVNVFHGGEGDDFFLGSDGNDVYSGGDGFDHLSYEDLGSAYGTVNIDLRAGRVLSDEFVHTISGIDQATGSGYDDLLIAHDEGSRLYGGWGDDYIEGGVGEDDLNGQEGSDTVSYMNSTSAVSVNLSQISQSGGYAEGDRLEFFESVVGSRFGDTIAGDSGYNNLSGGAGNDLFVAGSGTDTIQGGEDSDTVSFENLDRVRLELEKKDDRDGSVSAWVNSGVLVAAKLYDVENIVGSGGADHLAGDENDNTLEGGSGADTLIGGDGSDTLSYASSSAGVTISLPAGTSSGGDAEGDSISGFENLTGSEFADNLTAGGNISARGGSDTLTVHDSLFATAEKAVVLDGGSGQDTLVLSGVSSAQSGARLSLFNETAADGAGSLVIGQRHLVIHGIENAVGTGFDDWIKGDGETNHLDGGVGDDTIEGGGSEDNLEGGEGFDLITYANHETAIRLDLSGSQTQEDYSTEDQAWVIGDTVSGFEAVTGSDFGDELIDSSDDNLISGEGGDDTIKLSSGADTVRAGAGDDVVHVSVTDLNELATGSSRDSLYGGAGFDSLNFEGMSGRVTVDLQGSQKATYRINGTDVGGDVIQGFEGVIGTDYADQITGSDGENVLFGGRGRDTISGGEGDDLIHGGNGLDVLSGGNGFDIASYEDAEFAIRFDLNGTQTEQYRLGSSWLNGDSVSGFEGVIGTSLNDELIGDDDNNVLTGGRGRDTINGGDGDDLIQGGHGLDVLSGGDGFDIVSYEDAEFAIRFNLNGTQTEQYRLGSSWLNGDSVSGFEGVIGTSFDDEFIDGTAANFMDGGQGNDRFSMTTGENTISGGDGDDTIEISAPQIENDYKRNVIDGEDGFDKLSYENSQYAVRVDLGARAKSSAYQINGTWVNADLFSSIEAISGSNFEDALSGGDGGERLWGNSGADTLDGGGGDDLIHGGAGIDHLDGGTGFDIVSFEGEAAAVKLDLRGTQKAFSATGTNWAAADSVANFEGGIGTDFNDVLIGNETDNLLKGGAGQDTIQGGSGDDLVEGGEGRDSLSGGLGTDIVSYEHSGKAVKVRLGAQQTVQHKNAGVWKLEDIITGFEGVIGSSLSDELTGDNQDNTLEGGKGADTLTGGYGSDTYFFLRGDGHDRISDFGGQNDEIVFQGTGSDSGISSDYIWFTQNSDGSLSVLVGNASTVSQSDVTDRLDITGDTLNFPNENPIERFEASGKVLEGTNVDRLIQAMAGVSAFNYDAVATDGRTIRSLVDQLWVATNG